MPHRSATEMDRATCLRLLETRSLGRLVFTHRALPDVLPVNYRLDRPGGPGAEGAEQVLIRLAIGSAVAAAVQDAVVAFETDDVDPHTLVGWSVTVVGWTQEITADDDRLAAVMRGLPSWSDDGRDHYFVISTKMITGHRLRGSPWELRQGVQSDHPGPHRAGGAA